MDFCSAGVSTLQQNVKALQQLQQQQQQQQQQQHQQHHHHHHQNERRQQLNIEPGNDANNLSQPAFVAPGELSSLSRAPPLVVSDSSSSSSRGWQHSPASNALSSPATSITSPRPSTTTPPIDPVILLNSAGGGGEKAKPMQTTESATKTTDSPKRRRGRPRLSESDARDRDTRVTRAANAAKETPTAAAKTQQHKKKAAAAAAARRASTASASGADDPSLGKGAVDDKKDRIRARNREAAYKCRKKKQKGIERLQEEESMAENINKTLHSEAALLRSEILMLKNMVLEHGGCGCSYIEEYISGAAQNLVHSNLASSTTQSAGSGMAVNGQQDLLGTGGDDFDVDWRTFGMDSEPALSALESESGFSGVDDASVAHSSRAQSLGLAMV